MRPRQRPFDVAERQALVAGEDQVTTGGQRNCEQHLPMRDGGEFGEDILEVKLAAQSVEGHDRHAEQRHRYD